MKKFIIANLLILIFCAFGLAQESKPLRIIEKPQPIYPENSGNICASGTVRLRVEFLASGKIGRISPISTMPYFMKSAVEAAEKIKFQPAIQGVNKVSIFKEVDYNFGYNAIEESVQNRQENTRNSDLIILEKPRPELPKDYGTLDAQGSILLKVEFLANEQIGNISLVRNFISTLDQNAIEAARKIKFKPAIKNGAPITVNKVIFYNYSWECVGWCTPAQKLGEIKKDDSSEKAEAIIKKAVQKLGGDKYLQVKTTLAHGFFNSFKDGVPTAPSSFVDYVVFPDKNRTDFKSVEGKTIQANFGDKGWIVDGAAKTINDQTPKQIENFHRAIRISLDNLLRGGWRGEKDSKLEYIGRREGGLGKRNDALRLTYGDGLIVEYEFAVPDALPVKVLYKGITGEGEEIKEEDRFAQFVENQGIFAPFIIDHYINGKQVSRVNYQSLEYNTPISDALFTKPADIKKVK